MHAWIYRIFGIASFISYYVIFFREKECGCCSGYTYGVGKASLPRRILVALVHSAFDIFDNVHTMLPRFHDASAVTYDIFHVRKYFLYAADNSLCCTDFDDAEDASYDHAEHDFSRHVSGRWFWHRVIFLKRRCDDFVPRGAVHNQSAVNDDSNNLQKSSNDSNHPELLDDDSVDLRTAEKVTLK
jgi:hypothetical protein